MSRPWKALVGMLAVQAALSGAAVVVDVTASCAACSSRGLAPGIAGLALYAALTVLAWTRGPSRLVFAGILFAFGVHAALTAQMILSGMVCGVCLAAASGSLVLVGLAIAVDPANLGRLALIAPWSALLVAVVYGSLRRADPVAGSATPAVSVVVFTQPDCAYCDELRNRVLPEIEKEFGARVRINYRPAADLPAVRKTPTLILTPARVGVQGRVIEGLPTLERLRGAIRDLETRS